jgi:hypothetical protein
MYPRTPGLIPQSGTKGPFLLLFRNAGISRKAGPRFWIQQHWYRYSAICELPITTDVSLLFDPVIQGLRPAKADENQIEMVAL